MNTLKIAIAVLKDKITELFHGKAEVHPPEVIDGATYAPATPELVVAPEPVAEETPAPPPEEKPIKKATKRNSPQSRSRKKPIKKKKED